MAKMNKLSPVLIVEEIESCLAFWTNLGFSKTVEIPEGDKLGFVIFEKDGIEIMYQSMASVQKDVPSVAENGLSNSAIYIECEGLMDLLPKLDKRSIVVNLRKTFYGSNEVFVREPAGNIVGFAEKG